MSSDLDTLRARFADTHEGVAIEASSDALRSLASLLSRAEPVTVTLNADFDPAPYAAAGRTLHLRVEPDSTTLAISREGADLIISGGANALDILADNLRFAAASPREHIHVEYFPDHFYLRPDSMPAVVQALPPGGHTP